MCGSILGNLAAIGPKATPNTLRGVGPLRAIGFDLVTSVDQTEARNLLLSFPLPDASGWQRRAQGGISLAVTSRHPAGRHRHYSSHGVHAIFTPWSYHLISTLTGDLGERMGLDRDTERRMRGLFDGRTCSRCPRPAARLARGLFYCERHFPYRRRPNRRGLDERRHPTC